MALLFFTWVCAAAVPLALVPQASPAPEVDRPVSGVNETGSNTTSPVEAADDVPWTYGGEKTGTSQWGALSPSYKLCSEGTKQSPVNVENVKLTTKESSSLPLLVATFKPSAINLENDGHNVFMTYDAGSTIKLGDLQYEVKKLVFKSPSEHTISGQPYSMEVQIVCQVNGTTDTAIIAVLLQEHQNDKIKNQFLEKFWEKLPTEANTKVTVDASVNVADLCPKDITYYSSTGGLRIAYPYYSYDGSLTTPPCTENVKWFVWYKPVDIFADQVTAFRSVIDKMGEKDGNRRPIQALNERVVEFKTLF